MLGGSSQALIYLGSRTVSEDEIEFEFSQPVTIRQISFDPHLSVASVEEGSIVKVKFEESAKPGIMLTADLLAEDNKRNTINVLVSLRSRNNRMPRMVINEICTEHSNPRTEFIEFRMLTDGNIGAMRVIIMGNTNASRLTVYEFKPAEVKKDEYMVLHLRTVEDSCVDEYTDNLNLSGGRNATPNARDIWIPGNSKRIHKEASVVYVLDQDDNVICGVMISTEVNDWWSKDYIAEAAGFLYKKGVWQSVDGKLPSPADAIRSTGTTNTRTINRNENAENTNTKIDWYVTVTSGATPGRANNTGRYQN